MENLPFGETFVAVDWLLASGEPGFLEVYDVIVLVLLTVLSINCVLNVCGLPVVKRRKAAFVDGKQAPRVSVLVPARNEAHQIEPCLESLQAQTYQSMEVLVLDDCSDDGTASIAEELGFRSDAGPGSRFRLIRGEPMPPGWTGKPWACHQLAREASGDFLLFTDADTAHHPSSVESAVVLASEKKTHLLSVWPHQITLTWSEKLVIPVIQLLSFLLVPLWLYRVAQRSPAASRRVPAALWKRCAAANGRFLLFTREAYEELGGHEAVKTHLVEDIAFGRKIADRLPAGWRLLNADGRQIVESRMYHGFHEVWEGFGKNLCPFFEKRLGDFALVGMVLLMTMVLPFFFFFAREQPWLVALQIQFILLIRLLLTLRFETSWLSLILHPIAVLVTLGIAFNSWWLFHTGKITWKRRDYDWRTSDARP